MKGLTIQQPYASLIALPDDNGLAKRVENRMWSTVYRGPLLIHAGKGRDYLDLEPGGTHEQCYGLAVDRMAFGAVVAVARLAGCFWLNRSVVGVPQIPLSALNHWPWLASHRHVEGPACWVLSEVVALPRPIPWRGGQKLWSVPEELRVMVDAQLAEVGRSYK